jgi:hypothetical protein
MSREPSDRFTATEIIAYIKGHLDEVFPGTKKAVVKKYEQWAEKTFKAQAKNKMTPGPAHVFATRPRSRRPTQDPATATPPPVLVDGASPVPLASPAPGAVKEEAKKVPVGAVLEASLKNPAGPTFATDLLFLAEHAPLDVVAEVLPVFLGYFESRSAPNVSVLLMEVVDHIIARAPPSVPMLANAGFFKVMPITPQTVLRALDFMLDLVTHAPRKITIDYIPQFVKLTQVAPEHGVCVMEFYFERMQFRSVEIGRLALGVAEGARAELCAAPAGGRILHHLFQIATQCPALVTDSAAELGAVASHFLESPHTSTITTAYRFLCNLGLSPSPDSMRAVVAHLGRSDTFELACQLLTRAPVVRPSKELLDALLTHAHLPLAWALIARIAEMPGGADCLLANTEWVRPDRPAEAFGVFLVLARSPSAFTLRQYPEVLAGAATVANDQLLAMLPFVVGQGPLTPELLGKLVTNGFIPIFFEKVMQSRTADLQRVAIYLVTLFLSVGWIDWFGTYLQYVVHWMELPEIASEVLTFIVECSVYQQAITIIQQVGLLEYFQGISGDPNIGPLAQRLLANVGQNHA